MSATFPNEAKADHRPLVALRALRYCVVKVIIATGNHVLRPDAMRKKRKYQLRCTRRRIAMRLCAHTARNTHPPRTGGLRGRFPSRTVTLFTPDDYYLGTRKFMDLLTVPWTQRGLADRIADRTAAVCFAYDENVNRTCAR